MPTNSNAHVPAKPKRSSSATAVQQKTTKQLHQKPTAKALGQVPARRLRSQQATLTLREENEEVERKPVRVIATNPASKKLTNPQTCSNATAVKKEHEKVKRKPVRVIATNPVSKKLPNPQTCCNGTGKICTAQAVPDLLLDVAHEKEPVTTSLSLPVTPKVPERYIDPDSDVQQPQLVAEYAKDIYNNLLIVERKEIYQIDAEFLISSRFTVKPLYRAILIDWLIQVQERCELLNETMYLCVDILDRMIQVSDTSCVGLTLILVFTIFLFVDYFFCLFNAGRTHYSKE